MSIRRAKAECNMLNPWNILKQQKMKAALFVLRQNDFRGLSIKSQGQNRVKCDCCAKREIRTHWLLQSHSLWNGTLTGRPGIAFDKGTQGQGRGGDALTTVFFFYRLSSLCCARFAFANKVC